MTNRAGNILKAICAAVAAILVVTYMIVVCVKFGSDEPVRCKSVNIEILDEDLYSFITTDDIKEFLSQSKSNPIGRPASFTLADSIEKSINSISFVKKSECYISCDGTVFIKIRQREPVLLVKTEVSSYYIDSERTRFPVSKKQKARVPIVSGRVSEKMAKNEVYDFLAYIKKDDFYKNHIEQIHFDKEGNAFLGTCKGVPVVKLGTLENYQSKLAKLYAWYQQYPEFAWGDKYQRIDLSFKGLIYCTKK